MQTEITDKSFDVSNYKPNSSKPVYKFNSDGELVHKYDRITDAIHGEHVSHAKMSDLLCSGIPLRGHTFSRSASREPTEHTTDNHNDDQMPREADNGMFDISGWGKICF